MIQSLVFSLIVLGSVGLIIGALLGWLNTRYARQEESIADQIEALLPLTQCAQCGYPGCRPYAEAIAKGGAINQCPPGGAETIEKLAHLLGREAKDLDEHFGQHKGLQVALIDEQNCIGCTLCLPVCPVDAIVGANQLMHTVIESHCTGCELCIEPCPVDCISLISPLAFLSANPASNSL